MTSAVFNFGGVLMPPADLAVTTVESDLLAPTGKGDYQLIRIALANNAASDCEISLYWHDGSTSHLFAFVDVVAKKTEYVDFPIRLGAAGSDAVARKIRATAEANSRVTATAAYSLVNGKFEG